MSVSDRRYSASDRAYETHFDPSADGEVCTEIIRAIEAAPGVRLPDKVLADTIDPDSIAALFGGRTRTTNWKLAFEHGDILISLWGDGRIRVEPASTSAVSTRHVASTN